MPKTNTYSQRGVYVNTTDATQTVATTFQTKSNKAYHVDAKIVATETADFDEVASYVRRATFKNDGGTLTLIGSITSDHTGESTSGWDVTLDASGTTIRALVTGASATDVTWLADLTVTEVGKYVANAGIVE